MAIKSEMLSALDTKLDNAKAELKHHQKRTVELTSQVERLTTARKSLADILTAEDDREEEGVSVKRTRAPKSKSDLPRTDKKWWLELITDKPQGNAAILDAACVKAGVDKADSDKVAALKLRQTATLKSLFDEKSIASEGEQQKRVYFLPKQAKQA